MRVFIHNVVVFLLILCALSLKTFGNPNSPLQTTLQQKYLHKVFTIRNFYVDNDLYFASDGTAKSGDHVGSWTIASVAISKIKIKPDHLLLEGKRVAEIYDPDQRKFIPLLTGQDLTIFLDRDASQSDARVEHAFERIFLGPQDNLGDLVPDYWKPLNEGKVQLIPQKHGPVCFRVKGEFQKSANGKIIAPCEEDAKDTSDYPKDANIDLSTLPYVSMDVKGPKPKFSPDPDYDSVARAAMVQGQTILHIIVAPDGSTTDIVICRPLGFGLDDRAVAAVKKWKFEPATLNGVAVPVRITVQIQFHLY